MWMQAATLLSSVVYGAVAEAPWITPLRPFGAIIEHATIDQLVGSGAVLRHAWRDAGGLLVMRGLQSLSPEEFLAVSELFGSVEEELDSSKQAFAVAGLSSVMRIGNVRDTDTGKLVSMHSLSAPLPSDGSPQYRPEDRAPVWHTDSTYRQHPPVGSLLFCKTAPPWGGATCFADASAAFESLDEATRERLSELECVCSLAHHDAKVHLSSPDYPTLTAAQRAANPPRRVPCVLTHPLTGRQSLYGVNSGTCAVVPIGQPLEEEELDRCELDAHEMPSVQMLRSLLPFVTGRRFVVKWQWREGDLVVWDNRCTMHCATGFDHEHHEREMWRTTLAYDFTDEKASTLRQS